MRKIIVIGLMVSMCCDLIGKFNSTLNCSITLSQGSQWGLFLLPSGTTISNFYKTCPSKDLTGFSIVNNKGQAGTLQKTNLSAFYLSPCPPSGASYESGSSNNKYLQFGLSDANSFVTSEKLDGIGGYLFGSDVDASLYFPGNSFPLSFDITVEPTAQDMIIEEVEIQGGDIVSSLSKYNQYGGPLVRAADKKTLNIASLEDFFSPVQGLNAVQQALQNFDVLDSSTISTYLKQCSDSSAIKNSIGSRALVEELFFLHYGLQMATDVTASFTTNDGKSFGGTSSVTGNWRNYSFNQTSLESPLYQMCGVMYNWARYVRGFNLNAEQKRTDFTLQPVDTFFGALVINTAQHFIPAHTLEDGTQKSGQWVPLDVVQGTFGVRYKMVNGQRQKDSKGNYIMERYFDPSALQIKSPYTTTSSSASPFFFGPPPPKPTGVGFLPASGGCDLWDVAGINLYSGMKYRSVPFRIQDGSDIVYQAGIELRIEEGCGGLQACSATEQYTPDIVLFDNINNIKRRMVISSAVKTFFKNEPTAPWAVVLQVYNNPACNASEGACCTFGSYTLSCSPQFKIIGLIRLNPLEFPLTYNFREEYVAREGNQILNETIFPYSVSPEIINIMRPFTLDSLFNAPFNMFNDVTALPSYPTQTQTINGVSVDPINPSYIKYKGTMAYDWGSSVTLGTALKNTMSVLKGQFVTKAQLPIVTSSQTPGSDAVANFESTLNSMNENFVGVATEVYKVGNSASS